MMKEKTKRIWDFFNSNLVLWVLSLIALNLIPLFYAKYSECLKQKSFRIEQMQKLDQEIEGRIYQLYEKIERNIDSINGISKDEIKNLLWDFKLSPLNSQQGFYNVYPEFRNRNSISLIIELLGLCDNKNESKKIREVSDKLLSNKHILDIENFNDKDTILNYINNELRIERWNIFWPKYCIKNVP